MLSFKPGFPHSSFTFIKRLFSSSSLPAVRVVCSAPMWTFFLEPRLRVCVHAESLRPPGPSVHGLFWTQYWNGLPCSPPEDLPNPGTELTSFVSPALQADSLPLSHQTTTEHKLRKVEREDLKGVVGRGKAVGSESGWGSWGWSLAGVGEQLEWEGAETPLGRGVRCGSSFLDVRTQSTGRP